MAELLRMPEIAANTAEAVLESWNVSVNTPYAAGDPIVTVETEKAVVDVESEHDGVLLRLLVDAGTTVAVGTPIAVWGAPDEPAADVDALVAALGGPGGTPADPPPRAPVAGRTERETTSTRLFASPLARRLARELSVDLGTVAGSGPRGRIRRPDVEAAAAAGRAEPKAPRQDSGEPRPPVAAARFVDVPHTRMRAAIARRLTESKQHTPHFYLRAGVRVDALLDLRQQINAGQDVKVSINDMLVKAVASAHARVPAMNVQWNGDSIRHFTDVDIAVAVATDGGLVTPVVRAVDSLSLGGVAKVTKDLIARAKERRLRQDELEGGTISITNLGMYGTEDFAAIINPPQAAILAVGAVRQEAVVEEGAVVVGSVLRLTLAVDHRSVDGATAAEWTKAFVDVLEHPLRILL
ncbi:dihydrolipoamide acetyltransferase family protein [Streptomyces sp. NPDC088732]|uniref:dihydrolipoamide acetyltransferase family protein n=1 Tax=Streptomyces sp. NPDC088732 TaxID=3365879 RepID=UPI0038091B8D